MSDLAIARAQAIVQQAKANAASLVNVRDRCQHAADSWSKIADRLEKVGFVPVVDTAEE